MKKINVYLNEQRFALFIILDEQKVEKSTTDASYLIQCDKECDDEFNE